MGGLQEFMDRKQGIITQPETSVENEHPYLKILGIDPKEIHRMSKKEIIAFSIQKTQSHISYFENLKTQTEADKSILNRFKNILTVLQKELEKAESSNHEESKEMEARKVGYDKATSY